MELAQSKQPGRQGKLVRDAIIGGVAMAASGIIEPIKLLNWIREQPERMPGAADDDYHLMSCAKFALDAWRRDGDTDALRKRLGWLLVGISSAELAGLEWEPASAYPMRKV